MKKSNNFSNNIVIQVIKNNAGIISVLLIISTVLSLNSDVFLTTSNLLSVLRQISNNTYLALGMTLIMILGGIDLSVGAIVAMCSTLTVGFMVTNDIPMVAAILLSVSIGTSCGFISGVIIAYFKVPAFIVTLSMMNIAKGVAYVYSGGRSTRIMEENFNSIGIGYLGFLPLPVIYMIVLIIIFSVLLNKTKFGTYIYICNRWKQRGSTFICCPDEEGRDNCIYNFWFSSSICSTRAQF